MNLTKKENLAIWIAVILYVVVTLFGIILFIPAIVLATQTSTQTIGIILCSTGSIIASIGVSTLVCFNGTVKIVEWFLKRCSSSETAEDEV